MSQYTPRHREAFLKPELPPHQLPHRLIHRPVPRLEDLIKTSLKACEGYSVRITAASHTLEHAFVDWSENLNELEKSEFKAKAAIHTDLVEAQKLLDEQYTTTVEAEVQLSRARELLVTMEDYLGQEQKWSKMDRVIAGKQRQREENIKLNILKIERSRARRRKIIYHVLAASIAALFALIAYWTIQESRHPTILPPPSST